VRRIAQKHKRFGLHGIHMIVIAAFLIPACEGRSAVGDGGDAGDAIGFDADAGPDQVDDGFDAWDGGADLDPWADFDPDPACARFEDLYGQDLRDALLQEVDNQDALSYDGARHQMFSFIDNINGSVQGVYTGQWVVTDDIPDASVMNTEHTWCQSWGADVLPAKSDLNHLFPTISNINSVRSNYPFGEVVEVSWSLGGSLKGRDGWGSVVFEPRDPHKGDCARAMLYSAVRYSMEIPDREEAVLKWWNAFDLPDAKERDRCDRIEQIQHKRNPFVDCPELVDRIENY
jgi:deoxyribonuclease I